MGTRKSLTPPPIIQDGPITSKDVLSVRKQIKIRMAEIKPFLSDDEKKQGKAYEKITYKRLVDDEPADSILLPQLADMAKMYRSEPPAIQYEQLKIMGRFITGSADKLIDNARTIAIVRHFE